MCAPHRSARAWRRVVSARSVYRATAPSIGTTSPRSIRGAERIADLTEYQSLLEYAKPNLARITKLGASALVAAGAMTGVGLFAAPLVGGAIGTMVGGYSGAAATRSRARTPSGGAVGSSTFAFGMAGWR